MESKYNNKNNDNDNEDEDSTSKLSLEIFQNIFKKFEPEIEINFFEEARGSGRGDNYTAALYRVHLRGYYRHYNVKDGEHFKWEKTVICKRLPDNLVRREAYKSVQLFRNEVEFYTSIIPELIEFQKSKTDEIFNAIPQCYLARHDLLIMEDLRIRGFQMANRQKGLSIQETEAILKEIAKLHSLSLAYKIQYPKKFDKLKNLVTEGMFCPSNEEWYKRYYSQLSKNAVKMVSDVLTKDSKYYQRLSEFVDDTNFFSRMIDLVNKESLLSVICHGDCWTNNFLYRYDDLGNVIETSIVDFQLIRYGSPALDVSNIIYCCTTKSIRDEYLQTFIKLYINELFNSLISLCCPPDYCNTESKLADLFSNELKIYGKFALGIALDIIPISTCSSEDAPDLYIDRPDEPDGAPLLNFPPNDLCRQKITELLIDLVDGEML